jgi:hypothetical protein
MAGFTRIYPDLPGSGRTNQTGNRSNAGQITNAPQTRPFSQTGGVEAALQQR